MELSNAIKLIEAGVNKAQQGTWADLGAGAGLFTRALATLLPKGSTIYAVDANKSALEKIKATDGIELIKIHADFETLSAVQGAGEKIERKPALSAVEGAGGKVEHQPALSAVEGSKAKIERSRDLRFLDGILMANSLHFVKDKISFIKKAITWLKPDGCFVIVEYNTDKRNTWVPYPISFESATELFDSIGCQVKLIGEEKSKYNKEGMYAAVLNQTPQRPKLES